MRQLGQMNSLVPTRDQPLGDAEDAQRQEDEPLALLAAGNLLQATHVHLLISHPTPQNTHLLFLLIMKAVHAYYLKHIYR